MAGGSYTDRICTYRYDGGMGQTNHFQAFGDRKCRRLAENDKLSGVSISVISVLATILWICLWAVQLFLGEGEKNGKCSPTTF